MKRRKAPSAQFLKFQATKGRAGQYVNIARFFVALIYWVLSVSSLSLTIFLPK